MNTLQKLLIRLGLDAALQKQADEIAAECSAAVASRLTNGHAISSANEARGYIRARAATTIHRHVAELEGLTSSHRQKLGTMVAERLSQRFATPLIQRPVVQRRAA